MPLNLRRLAGKLSLEHGKTLSILIRRGRFGESLSPVEWDAAH